MNLDILTPKGQDSLQKEQRLLQSFEAHFKGYSVLQTPKDKPATIDGIITKGGSIVGVFESKCRESTREQMRDWNNQWLVTYEKIRAGADAAKNLCVKFTGLLYLTRSQIGLAVPITDEWGNFVAKITLQRTITQRTTNGGSAIRTNAYIDLKNAKEFPIL